ncbi:ABC-type transport auxiliary lipoprotein family protein [Marinobacter sp.]|uniref:ABC-type transport auxiliary lipoprotein family protein n=1 Tax=Marinobacter sp. TaxID=50741 RepID=UPI002B26698B|nr:ABC-type transport auxiliary lipoprotein family protein [Marinobacter sp.]
MNTGLARLAVVTTVLTTTACTVIPRPEPPRVMSLAGVPSQATFDQALPVNIRVVTPLASDPVDSSSILIKPTPYEFLVYKKARWRDSSPVVIRDHLAQHLRNSQGFRNIVVDTSAATTGLTLLTELSAFHVDQKSNEYQVTLQLHAELTGNRSSESLCINNWAIEEPSAGADLDSAVEAFSRAGNLLAYELTEWLWSCVQQAQ